ncbi:MerR family transcriptional regulator [Frigoribacterium sp. PvP032]|uniref:helix-turn-helix domain-containing protein n=1 Tax=Frigoribacterium sp. PvP032 TaxID=2806589 RepID=UPI001AEABA17|nr:MerR family transcriptional regulator [Frigoribacterium sp. PvP032]MBP1189882.1 DNA-binding transcriptional MerR regulator [Frigoribacterium sp. PvP032]
MSSSFVPPRQVAIGDAATFAGTTPRAIRHYHSLGLLPEPERDGGGRRRYDYDDMIRLLWIRKMTDAGIALGDIRDAFAGPAASGADASGAAGSGSPDGAAAGEPDVAAVLEQLEATLEAKEAELQRQRAAVGRMRALGSRTGLLDAFVSRRLTRLPEGSLRQDDLDTLLVTERIFGPLGAAVQAGRFVALATSPGLRAESDRVDAAEQALDDTVAVDDPRVAEVAAQRHAFEEALLAVIEESGQDAEDDALFAAWDELHPEGAEPDAGADGGSGSASGSGGRRRSRSLADAVGMVPYDFSPARARCLELSLELSLAGAADESSASAKARAGASS